MTRGAVAIVILAAGLIVAAAGFRAFLTTGAEEDAEPALDFAHPTRHFRVPNPARLSDADALSIYDRIRDDMVAAYRPSRDPETTQFYKWRRYNRTPYLSSTHGNRSINNYANWLAKDYGRQGAGPMPEGAVLAKDSFTVTRQGDVFTGPLFLMEKMPPGFSATTRDWRYTMIMPDGSVFGTTDGAGSERVDFCATCHAKAGAAADHLFFETVDFFGPAGIPFIRQGQARFTYTGLENLAVPFSAENSELTARDGTVESDNTIGSDGGDLQFAIDRIPDFAGAVEYDKDGWNFKVSGVARLLATESGGGAPHRTSSGSAFRGAGNRPRSPRMNPPAGCVIRFTRIGLAGRRACRRRSSNSHASRPQWPAAIPPPASPPPRPGLLAD